MPGAQTKIMAPMTGKNGRLVWFQDDQKMPMDFKSWSLKPNVTKFNDAINGESRDQLDMQLNFYEISGQMYARDAQIIQAWIAQQKVRDANTAPLPQDGAVRFYPNNGTRQSFVLVGMIWDDFEINNGGRSEKMMVPVSFRCEDIAEAKTL